MGYFSGLLVPELALQAQAPAGKASTGPEAGALTQSRFPIWWIAEKTNGLLLTKRMAGLALILGCFVVAGLLPALRFSVSLKE